MRRGFIAIFTLHFLVSMVLFAFGQTGTRYLADPAPQFAAATTVEHADPAQDGDLLGSAPDHGLTDAQPEMPDGLHLVTITVASGGLLERPISRTLSVLPPPTLDGPQRPPRSLRATA